MKQNKKEVPGEANGVGCQFCSQQAYICLVTLGHSAALSGQVMERFWSKLVSSLPSSPLGGSTLCAGRKLCGHACLNWVIFVRPCSSSLLSKNRKILPVSTNYENMNTKTGIEQSKKEKSKVICWTATKMQSVPLTDTKGEILEETFEEIGGSADKIDLGAPSTCREQETHILFPTLLF